MKELTYFYYCFYIVFFLFCFVSPMFVFVVVGCCGYIFCCFCCSIDQEFIYHSPYTIFIPLLPLSFPIYLPNEQDWLFIFVVDVVCCCSVFFILFLCYILIIIELWKEINDLFIHLLIHLYIYYYCYIEK